MRTILIIVLVAVVATSSLASQERRYPGCGAWDRQSPPDWFTSWFHGSPVAKTHDVACYVNPFYQRGNFDGQGRLDLAVLVVGKNTENVASSSSIVRAIPPTCSALARLSRCLWHCRSWKIS